MRIVGNVPETGNDISYQPATFQRQQNKHKYTLRLSTLERKKFRYYGIAQSAGFDTISRANCVSSVFSDVTVCKLIRLQ